MLQNRDRNTPGSIAQMQSIALQPDYGRLGYSRDFAAGAPVVAGGNVPAAQLGRQDVAVASDGRRIPVQYAVVEASSVLTSNDVNGSSIPQYADPSVPGMRAIAGNGRLAGLRAAYGKGTTGQYLQELQQDDLHGISPDVIRGMRAPVLVRVMPTDQVTPNIGDVSNTSGTLDLNAVEQAKQDMRRVNLDALQFAEDGGVAAEAVRQFVRGMPLSEQGKLIDNNGQPTRQAIDRLNAAIFARAYGNDSLVRLYAQAQDPEARNVLSALAQAAPKMARLEGAGPLDVRDVVTQAAEIAVNARRDGKSLASAIEQPDLMADPDVAVVLSLFASNARTVRPVVEALSRMADMAYTETSKPAEDMFGAVPRATRADVINQLRPQDGRAIPQAVENPAGGQRAQQVDEWRALDSAGTAAPEQDQAVGPDAQPAQQPAAEQQDQGVLTSYTPEELRQREQQLEQQRAELEQRERELARREQADAELDSFTLTGSDRQADVLAAQGQQDLLAQPEQAEPAALAEPETQPETGQPAARSPGRVENFGERLPGGRRNMPASLAQDLTDQDIATKPFSQIWPAAEVDAIEDKFTAAVAYAARAEVPAKPRVAYKLTRWVEKVKGVRELAQRITSGQFTPQEFMDRLRERTALQAFADKVELLNQIDRSQWGRIGHVEAFPEAYRMEGEQRIASPLVRVEIDGKNRNFSARSVAAVVDQVNEQLAGETAAKKMQFEIRRNTKTGEVFINKVGDKEYRRLKTFDDVKQARAYMADNYADLMAAWEAVKESDNVRKTDVRSETNRPRTGTDRRNGQDVTPEQFSQTFGFRGVEFGNWVSQGANAKERQGMLNQAYDALLDLAEIVNVPPRAMSLNGTLGLAFGSRGSGNASAHFEPSNLVINLTKTKGAGSLAHEWFHALDNYFARQRGGEVPMERGLNAQQAYRTTNYITYRPEPLYVHKTQRSTPITKAKLQRYHQQNPKSAYYNPDNWQVDPRHPNGVRPEVERAFADLVEALDNSPMAQRASSLDKGPDGYWSRIIERGARAFENYVITKMMERGIQNDYLANVRPVDEFPRSRDRYPYLLPEEVAPISEAFDTLFGTIQTRETDQGVALFEPDPSYGGLRDQYRFAGVRVSPTGMLTYQGSGFQLLQVGEIEQEDFSDNGMTANGLMGHASRVVPNTRTLKFRIEGADGRLLGALVADVDSSNTIRSVHDIVLRDRRAGMGTNIIAHLAASSDQPLRIQDVTQDAEPFWDRLGIGSFDPWRNADLDWEGVERAIQPGGSSPRDNGDAGGPRDAQDGDGDAQARPDLSGIDVQELSDEDVRRLFPGLNLEEGRRRYRTQKQADDRQLELFLSNGPDPSQAGPAGEAAQRAAVSAVDDLRSTATILGLALSRDYAARQRVSLVGQQVSSAEDLAVLAQVYRDPRFETFRVIFVNSRNEVVSQVGLTSRLPASAQAIVGNDVDGYLKQLADVAKNRGATGFYMLHNHPSGKADASQADMQATVRFARTVDLNFHGHVVIDTNEYSVIDANGRAELRQRDFGQPPPPASSDFAGRQIGGPQDVMAIAKEIETDASAVTLIITDNQYQVRGITTVPTAELQGSQDKVRRVLLRASLRTTGSSVFAVGRDLDVLRNIGDHIIDGVHVTESGQVETLVGKHRIGIGKSPFPQDRRSRVSPDTSPEFAYLRQSAQPASAQRVAEPERDYNPRSVQSAAAPWTVPEPGAGDAFIRSIQNNKIDLKRLREAITEQYGEPAVQNDAYLAEELYHGKVATRVEALHRDYVEPILAKIAVAGKNVGVTLDDVNQYLHARHAPERNAAMKAINPGMPNNEALSGMSNQQAAQVMADFRQAGKLAALQAIAKDVDQLLADNRASMVADGLEDAGVVQAWESAYKHYVPLQREIGSSGTPKGMGFSVRGPESKRAMGSNRAVVNILANIVAQAETTAIRAEKAKVGRALLAMARQYPNPDFWKVDVPPTKPRINKDTGLVERNAVDPLYQTADNVVMVKDFGQDHFIVFNRDSERAMMVARAMKNLDTAPMNRVLEVVGRGTRFLASMLTQRNPVFWLTNFARDIQGAMLNLEGTDAEGLQRQVLANLPSAFKGMHSLVRGDSSGQWARYGRELQEAGGTTGYMQAFENSDRRMDDLAKEIERMQRGLADPRTLGRLVLDFIDDYNDIIENAVRLSVFQAARDAGVATPRAASIAKNITVNFNRKGNVTPVINSLYMFFNASIQGTARLAQAIATSRKAQVAVGGIAAMGFLLDALNRAMAGEDDETGRNRYDMIPEFEKSKNWIIMNPMRPGEYLKVPLPLGPHIFHNSGRLLSDAMFRDDPRNAQEYAWAMANTLFDAFSPLGTASTLGQFIAPSVADPVLQLTENKSFTGAPVYKSADRGFGPEDPAPAYTRYFESTPEVWRAASRALNDLTGGDAVKPGLINVEPDIFKHVFYTFTGGPGRTLDQAIDSMQSEARGQETSVNRIPLASRFYGANDDRQRERVFFDDQKRVADAKAQFDYYTKKGRRDLAREVAEELGEGDYGRGLRMMREFSSTNTTVRKLNEQIKRELERQSNGEDRAEQLRALRERRTEAMTRAVDQD